MARLNLCSVVFLVLVIFILFNPSSSPQTATDEELFKATIAREKQNLNLLNSSSYGDFLPSYAEGEAGLWLNLTGFRRSDQYAWSLLPLVQQRVRQHFEYVVGASNVAILDGDTSQPRLPLYRNITGFVNGRWAKSNLGNEIPRPILNLSAIAPEAEFSSSTPFGTNITGTEGKLQVRLLERDLPERTAEDGKVRAVSATFTIQDESSYGDGWDLALYGVHFRDSGSLLLSTTSDKFAGIFGLAHFALTPYTFNLSQTLLNQSITRVIKQQEDDAENSEMSMNPWSSATSTSDQSSHIPHCDLIVFLQQSPIRETKLSGEQTPLSNPGSLEELESEIRTPTGKLIATAPQIELSMMGFSPDCGFVIESKGPPNYAHEDGMHLRGNKIEILITYSKRMMNFFCFVLLAQLWTYIREVKGCSAPSARSRISFYTLAMLSLGGGLIYFGFLFLACFVDSIFILSMVVSFLAFLHGNFFDMRFMKDVWTTQGPERREYQQRIAAQRQATADQSNMNATAPNNNDRESLPLPATATRRIDTGATPIPIPETTVGDQAQPFPTTTGPNNNTNNASDNFESFYVRFYLLLLSIFFLSLFAATAWPVPLRTMYANGLAFLYLSFWTPQIYRNIIRNCRKALSWRFILVQSVLRLIPFGYFWCIPDNVLFIENDRPMFVGMVAWLWVQIVALAVQDFLGPRVFVNESWQWVPLVWNYHPVLHEDEEGATLPVGFNVTNYAPSQSPSNFSSDSVRVANEPSTSSPPLSPPPKPENSNERGIKVYDCAICMQRLEVHVLPPDGAVVNTRGTYQSYRSTPAETEETGFLGSGGATGLSWLNTSTAARRHYMVTPCRHIFHTTCLEAWIGYRLQCPICRETLPPI